MPYVGFGREERQPVERPPDGESESSSLIERHVEEGVLKPSISARDYEQPLFIRCLKGCAGVGVFVHGRVCAVLSRSFTLERRFDALDGVRALAYLGVLALHADTIAASRYPDTYGDSHFRTSAARGDILKAPFRILMQGEDYFTGVFLVVGGFLASFVLFLRSGPLMQQVHETKSARVRAYIDLSTNFMCGRWLRLWPILQASVLLSLLWATFLTGSDDLAEEDLEPCKGTPLLANALMMSNVITNPCYGDLWTVSLIFQLYFCVPPAVYFYAQRRSLGYVFAWLLAALDFFLRLNSFYIFGIGNMEDTMHKRPWFRLGEFATGILLCFSFLDRFQIIQMKATKEQQAADARHAHEASKRAEKQTATDEEVGPFVDQSNSPAECTTSKNTGHDGKGQAVHGTKKAVNAVPSAPKIASLASIYGSAAKGQQFHSGLDATSHPAGGRDEVRGGRLLSELDGLSDTDSDEGESWGVKKPPVDWWVVFHPATWDTMYTHPLDIFAGTPKEDQNLSALGSLARSMPRRLLRGVILCLALLFLYEGNNPSAWVAPFTLETDQSRTLVASCADFVVSLAVGILLRSVLFGGRTWIAKALRCFLSSPLLYAPASLSYSGYLLSYPSVTWACQLLPNPSHNASFGYFAGVYSVSLGINLALAFPFSLLVERPMMDLRAQCGCARKREASNFCGSTTSSKGGSKRSSSGSGSTSNSSSRNIGSGQLKSGSSLSSSHQVSAYVLSSTSSQGQVSAVGVPRKVLVLQGGGREGGGEVLFSGHARQTYGAAPEDNPFR